MNRFLSFADSRMSAALERLGRQAEALDFFDEITLFTEHDLSAEFTSRMGRYLTPSCRGFGYWSWKPWSIHHVLQEMEEGDRLLYLDAGCHINANGTERFREYVNMLDRDSCGMLVFTNGQTGHGNPTGREKGMAGKMQAAPSFFQKKRIRNPVKLPHSEQPGCTTFPNGAI